MACTPKVYVKSFPAKPVNYKLSSLKVIFFKFQNQICQCALFVCKDRSGICDLRYADVNFNSDHRLDCSPSAFIVGSTEYVDFSTRGLVLAAIVKP